MPPEVRPGTIIQSNIPARLDALAWSRWHRRLVIALGITWILDGLEASLITNLAPTLGDPRALGLRAAQLVLLGYFRPEIDTWRQLLGFAMQRPRAVSRLLRRWRQQAPGFAGSLVTRVRPRRSTRFVTPKGCDLLLLKN